MFIFNLKVNQKKIIGFDITENPYCSSSVLCLTCFSNESQMLPSFKSILSSTSIYLTCSIYGKGGEGDSSGPKANYLRYVSKNAKAQYSQCYNQMIRIQNTGSHATPLVHCVNKNN